MTKRAFRYRFYPTPEQATLLARTFGCARFVHNAALRWRTDRYRDSGQRVRYNQASAWLTDLKASYPWLNEVSSVALQQVLRHQQAAFTNFFEGRARYPAFKCKLARQSVTLVRSAFRLRDGQLFIAKCGHPLPVRWTRELPSEPSSITLSRDRAGRYFVSLLCEFKPQTLPVSLLQNGIDIGLLDLFVLSNGFKSGNPKHLKRYEKTLSYWQRQLSKKQKGSANRAKLRRKVARLHAKIADCRRDWLHKMTRWLVNENQVLAIESLAVKNLLKNHRLAKHISDAAWGEFIRQLRYKCAWAGRTLVEIDRWFPSSKRCSECGYTHEKLPLKARTWTCPQCGRARDRDTNAAENILAAGRAVLACGATGTGSLATSAGL